MPDSLSPSRRFPALPATSSHRPSRLNSFIPNVRCRLPSLRRLSARVLPRRLHLATVRRRSRLPPVRRRSRVPEPVLTMITKLLACYSVHSLHDKKCFRDHGETERKAGPRGLVSGETEMARVARSGGSPRFAAARILPPLCSTLDDLLVCQGISGRNEVWVVDGGGMWSRVGHRGVRWLPKVGRGRWEPDVSRYSRAPAG